MSTKPIIVNFILLALILLPGVVSSKTNVFSNVIELNPGWNIVSTPRLVESHQFSKEESLDNFDILMLDPTEKSGWSTMVGLGQTEFEPLFAYFINNKTGLLQTLTLVYKEDVDPAQRLFSRSLRPGWNAIGVANPTYALRQDSPEGLDRDGVKNILVSLSSCVDTVLDFTANQDNAKSVSISKNWSSYVYDESNSLNDFRETKGYAVFVRSDCVFQGFQNIGFMDESDNQSSVEISFDGPDATNVRDDRDDVVLANLKINVVGDSIQIDTLPIVLTMGVATAADNLTNVEIVDTTNSVSYTVADQTNANVTHTYNFEDVNLVAGKSYTFQVRGDIPADATEGQTYQVAVDVTNFVGDVYVTSDEAVADDAYSSQTLTGKVMTVAKPSVTIAPVSTAAATYVKDAKGVLLYKGKITASGVDDLKVSKMKIMGTIGGGSDELSDAFSKIYLYSVAANGTETLLDSETSLTGIDDVSFSFGTTLTVPKGTSNGVYLVVRGDVKNAATAGTYSFAWAAASVSDYTVKDSDNNSFLVGQYTVVAGSGHTSTIATQGTYTMVIDNTELDTNADKNVLAGGVRLLGRIKVNAQKEDAIIEDLVLQATSSTMTNADIATLYLYEDKGMTRKLGSADFANGINPKAMFEDVNIVIPTTGTKYLYIAGQVKGIDYSASPASDSTGTAGRTVVLEIAASTGAYVTKVKGASTGEVLTNTYSPVITKTSTIMGAVISAVTTTFANGTLSNGVAKDIFSFKVIVPASSNVDYDGAALGIQLATTTFTIATSSGVALNSFKIERVGGANGEVVASASFNSTGLSIGFRESYGMSTDRIVKPGETAEFVIRATVSGVEANDCLQTTLENMGTNLPYMHNNGSAGTLYGVTPQVYPLIYGLSNVRGGTLCN